MKNKIFRYLLIAGCLSIFGSCSTEEAEVSTITKFADFSFQGLPDKLEVNEGETIELPFTFDDNQIFDLHLLISSGGDSAEEDVDFTLSDHSLDIKTLGKSGTFSFSALSDFLTEGDETLSITLSSDSPTNLPIAKIIEITIKDVVSQDLVLTFDWEGDFEFDGQTYTLCPNVDLDVYVLDKDGVDLGIYDAATGNCPEQLIFSSDLSDGDYYLASNMWENGLAGLMLNVDFPITVTAFKQDKFETSFTPTIVWNSEEDDQNTGGNTSFKEVAKVTKLGPIFTVTRPDGTIAGSGFKSPHKKVKAK